MNAALEQNKFPAKTEESASKEFGNDNISDRIAMSTITDISRTKSVLSTRSVDYVGFANFPNQVFRRCIKNGFEFTLMVVGKTISKI